MRSVRIKGTQKRDLRCPIGPPTTNVQITVGKKPSAHLNY
jgi:hypothetical protein